MHQAIDIGPPVAPPPAPIPRFAIALVDRRTRIAQGIVYESEDFTPVRSWCNEWRRESLGLEPVVIDRTLQMTN